MGTKKKWVETHRPAIEQIYKDVGTDSYKLFRVDEVPEALIAPGLRKKVVAVAVATSGSADEGRDWLALVPLRVDSSGSAPLNSSPKYVYDQDPTTFYLSSSAPGVSGSVSFHSSFPGRTEDVETPSAPSTINEAVADLRSRFVPTSGSLGDAKQSLQNALEYGAKQFRAMEAALDDSGIPPFPDD